jgi:hypothetical protein
MFSFEDYFIRRIIRELKIDSNWNPRSFPSNLQFYAYHDIENQRKFLAEKSVAKIKL